MKRKLKIWFAAILAVCLIPCTGMALPQSSTPFSLDDALRASAEEAFRKFVNEEYGTPDSKWTGNNNASTDDNGQGQVTDNGVTQDNEGGAAATTADDGAEGVDAFVFNINRKTESVVPDDFTPPAQRPGDIFGSLRDNDDGWAWVPYTMEDGTTGIRRVKNNLILSFEAYVQMLEEQARRQVIVLNSDFDTTTTAVQTTVTTTAVTTSAASSSSTTAAATTTTTTTKATENTKLEPAAPGEVIEETEGNIEIPDDITLLIERRDENDPVDGMAYDIVVDMYEKGYISPVGDSGAGYVPAVSGANSGTSTVADNLKATTDIDLTDDKFKINISSDMTAVLGEYEEVLGNADMMDDYKVDLVGFYDGGKYMGFVETKPVKGDYVGTIVQDDVMIDDTMAVGFVETGSLTVGGNDFCLINGNVDKVMVSDDACVAVTETANVGYIATENNATVVIDGGAVDRVTAGGASHVEIGTNSTVGEIVVMNSANVDIVDTEVEPIEGGGMNETKVRVKDKGALTGDLIGLMLRGEDQRRKGNLGDVESSGGTVVKENDFDVDAYLEEVSRINHERGMGPGEDSWTYGMPIVSDAEQGVGGGGTTTVTATNPAVTTTTGGGTGAAKGSYGNPFVLDALGRFDVIEDWFKANTNQWDTSTTVYCKDYQDIYYQVWMDANGDTHTAVYVP